MKKRTLMAALATLLICVSMVAHEFWISPARTHVLVGQRVPLQLTVGQNFQGDRWQGKGNRVISYNHYFRNDHEELLLSLQPGEDIVRLPDFIPRSEGTHILTFATNNAFIELPADEFEPYLKDNGLMDAFEYRNAHDEKFKKGREYFRRCAKVIIQAGEEIDHTFRERTNLILDIVPEKNPYNHDKQAGLTFKVLYEDAPLPDAMVKWYHKYGDKLESDFLYTNERGDVTFSAAEPGIYMISVAHMIRLTNDPGADWQSTWGSLVFGIDD